MIIIRDESAHKATKMKPPSLSLKRRQRTVLINPLPRIEAHHVIELPNMNHLRLPTYDTPTPSHPIPQERRLLKSLLRHTVLEDRKPHRSA